MNFLSSILIQGYSIPGTSISLDLPTFGGWFTGGIFSAIGQGLFIVIVLFVVVWIGFALYGAFLIISSLGDPQKIEKGWKTIKSVWIGISYFLIFFALITLGAVFIGIGAPWNWAENMQQCRQGGPAAGRFYFQGKFVPDATDPQGSVRVSYSEMISDSYTTTLYVICCEEADKKYIDVRSRPNNIPANCSLNSVQRLSRRTTPPSTCLASGQVCIVDGVGVGSCCGGLTCTREVPRDPDNFRCE